MNATYPVERLAAGTELGVTEWIALPQDLLTAFEVLTKSNDPLHMDPDWVRAHTQFGSTIAPGFLTLSLLPYFLSQLSLIPPGHVGVNYGFDRVRWIAPVPVNARVRARFVSGGEVSRANGAGFIARYEVTLEVEGEARPAMVASWLGAMLPDRAASA